MSAQRAAQALHDCGYIAAEDIAEVAKIIAEECQPIPPKLETPDGEYRDTNSPYAV